ncbi:MAG: type II toxin-antitoxin system RelE/ParE family toxin [Deltaproteobacteria bacterium]|nr:type II toxin-antitoxin system RelE/ParE family toxin [Deltaproteobacteria bacterium]
MRNVLIYGPAQREIKYWPVKIRKELGSVLTRLQLGESIGMPDVKPIPAVAKGASEIRVKDANGIYRAFFVIQVNTGILVFHGFNKKTQQTPHFEIETGKKRLKAFKEELSL